MDLLEAQAARGKTVVATTHDLACAAERFQQVLAVNRTVVAYGPSNLVLDADVLAAAYGGHLLVIEGTHRRARRRPPPRRRRARRAPLPRAGAPLMDLAARAARPTRSSSGPCSRSALVGVVCAVVGTYVVLRGIAFIGDAIAHAAFPGVVAAYMLEHPVLPRARRSPPSARRSRSGS